MYTCLDVNTKHRSGASHAQPNAKGITVCNDTTFPQSEGENANEIVLTHQQITTKHSPLAKSHKENISSKMNTRGKPPINLKMSLRTRKGGPNPRLRPAGMRGITLEMACTKEEQSIRSAPRRVDCAARREIGPRTYHRDYSTRYTAKEFEVAYSLLEMCNSS
jgi:hypothetical protein